MPQQTSRFNRQYNPTQPVRGQEASAYAFQELSRLSQDLKALFAKVNKDLNDLSGESSGDNPDLTALTARVAALELAYSQLATAVQELQSEDNGVDDLANQVNTLTNALSALTMRVASLEASVTSLTSVVKIVQVEDITAETPFLAYTEQRVEFVLLEGLPRAINTLISWVLVQDTDELPPEIAFAGCGYNSETLTLYAKFHNNTPNAVEWPACSVFLSFAY